MTSTEEYRVQISALMAEARTQEYEPPNYLPSRKTRVDWEAECWRPYNASTLKCMIQIRERMRYYWKELREKQLREEPLIQALLEHTKDD